MCLSVLKTSIVREKKNQTKPASEKKKIVILYRLNGFILFYGMQAAASVSVHSC